MIRVVINIYVCMYPCFLLNCLCSSGQLSAASYTLHPKAHAKVRQFKHTHGCTHTPFLTVLSPSTSWHMLTDQWVFLCLLFIVGFALRSSKRGTSSQSMKAVTFLILMRLASLYRSPLLVLKLIATQGTLRMKKHMHYIVDDIRDFRDTDDW